MGCDVVPTGDGGVAFVCSRGRTSGVCTGIGREPVVDSTGERCRGCGRKVGCYDTDDGRRICLRTPGEVTEPAAVDPVPSYTRNHPVAETYRCEGCGATVAGDDVHPEVVEMFRQAHPPTCQAGQ
jgi:hypothetical protein